MARLFDDAFEEYLEVTQAVVTGHPLVLACWVRTDDVSANQFLMAVHDDDLAAVDTWTLMLHSSGATILVRASSGAGGSFSDADTTANCSVNTWHHACAVFASSTSRAAFLDGANKGTNTTSRSPAGVQRTDIGAVEASGTVLNPMSGRIAEAGIWDLSAWPGATDADKAAEFERVAIPALAAGFAPSFFLLGLKAYWPLIRDEDQDRVGGYDMTAYNTPGIASHLPIIYPAPPHIVYASAAAPPPTAALPIFSLPDGIHSLVFGGITVR